MDVVNICRILVSLIIFSNNETAYDLFSAGYQLELEGKLDQAIEYYKQAKEMDPSSSEIYISLANALYQIGKINEGINYAEEGLSVAPDNAELNLVTAVGYIGKGDFKNGIKYYQKAKEIDPEKVEIYTGISILYEGSGDLNNAKFVLEDMPEGIKTPEIYNRLGSLTGKLNDHKKAIEYYRKAYAMDTTNITALIGISTGFDHLAINDSAIYYYEKTLEKEDNLTIAKRLVDLYSETDQYGKLIEQAKNILKRDYYDIYIRRHIGFALHKIGDVEGALSQFLIASKIDPQDAYSRFYAGRIYLEQGHYDAASNEIIEAININPDFVELWVYLGFISIDRNDLKIAEYAFTEAAYRGADIVQIYYLLGAVAEMQEKYPDAYFNYHKSLKIDPGYLASLDALANLCNRIDKEDESFETFRKIIELDSTNSIALNYVGYTLAERNESLDYALELIEKALSIEENNAYYIDSRGWVFYQMGKYEEALVDLKRASELIEDVVIYEHLGDVYMKLDQPIKAKQTYEKALEIEPDNKAIKEKLKNIMGN